MSAAATTSPAVDQPAATPLAAEIARVYGTPAVVIDLDKVGFNRDRIAFARSGMALTLNGVAQGYTTDCVIDLLRAGGVTSALANIGEVRALGSGPDGSPWRVAIHGGKTVEEAAKIFSTILKGEGNWAQNAVVLANAAMALHCTGKYSSYNDAYLAAVDSLDSGRAYQALQKLVAMQA